MPRSVQGWCRPLFAKLPLCRSIAAGKAAEGAVAALAPALAAPAGAGNKGGQALAVGELERMHAAIWRPFSMRSWR